MSRPNSAAAFAVLAAELHAEPDQEVTARTIVARLAELLPEADGVSLTVQVRGGHQTLASTSRLAEEADALQYELGQGPCVETADQPVAWTRSGDVANDARWSSWGPGAAAVGVGSLLSVQLLDNERSQGALNVYSQARGCFSDHDSIEVAVIYSMHAASALSAARLATNLQTAIRSRHVIGLAQGMVMERYQLDEHRSFELLRRLSSTHQLKLRDVAASIVETGDLPEASSDEADQHHQ